MPIHPSRIPERAADVLNVGKMRNEMKNKIWCQHRDMQDKRVVAGPHVKGVSNCSSRSTLVSMKRHGNLFEVLFPPDSLQIGGHSSGRRAVTDTVACNRNCQITPQPGVMAAPSLLAAYPSLGKETLALNESKPSKSATSMFYLFFFTRPLSLCAQLYAFL